VTAAKVIDASALAAVTFVEPHMPDLTQRLNAEELFAPALLRFEMAHICIKKIRARPAEREAILAQHDASLAIPIREVPVDQAQIIELSDRLNLSAYDASYLWLAHKLGAELITLDKQLEKAAAKI
jgi:predicted nucleic acid-binding protein